MKKASFLSVLFVLLTFVIQAQTQKGKWTVSGKTGLDFNSSTSKYYNDGSTNSALDYKSQSFSIAPSVGYFVIDNLALGLSGLFQSSKNKDGNDSWSDATNFYAIMPIANYYIPLDGMVRPVIGVGAGYGGMSNGSNQTDKDRGFLAAGSAGIAIFLNNTISFDISGQYQYSNFKNASDSKLGVKSGTISALAGFSLFF
ncbi:MAG: outer membrane beta-barrel protein [Niabella sp.]